MKLQGRVVVMDDEALFRRPFSKRLRREGLEVTIADSLRKLRKLAASQVFDAAVLDIRMSTQGMEGLLAVAELRSLFPSMYIEVITAFEEFQAPALTKGADAVFLKPDLGSEPGRRVREGIRRKRLEALESISGVEIDEMEFGEALPEETSLRAELLTNCIDCLDRYLVENERHLGLDPDSSRQLRGELAEALVRAEIAVGGARVLGFVEVEDDLRQDSNFRAWQASREELGRQYPGQVVGFAGGELVAVGPTRGDVAAALEREFPEKQSFIAEVGSPERVVYFRRPLGVAR